MEKELNIAEILKDKPKAEFKPFDKVVAFEELTKEWVCDDMSPKDFKRNFKGWLYIDDLFPKKGGNHD